MIIKDNLRKEFEDQELGTHMCCIYRNKQEQLTALSTFISLGIERNEKCLYVLDDRTKEEVIEFFKDHDLDVDMFIETGQFAFLTKGQSYLKEGYFEPKKMIELLKDATEEAIKEGYNGLRVTGEMTWFFTDIPGVERIMEYESKLNEFLPDNRVIALCQYNENKFPPDMLINVLRTHPKVLLYDDVHENPYFMPPNIFNAQLKGEITWEHYESMKEDIKQRTRLKRKERESRKKLERERNRARKYLETAEVMLVSIDKEGKVIQANRKTSEILGYDKEDIIGKDWFENFIPERNREEIKRIHQEMGESDYPEYHENTVLTRSGEERMILWHNSILEDEKGEIIGTLSSGMDITERRRAEEEIRELSHFRERIIQDARIWLNVLDNDANVILWNKAAEEISGYSKEEVLGHDRVWEWLYPDEEYRMEIVKRVDDILHGDETRGFETTIKCKNGEEKVISWSSHPLKDEEGEIIGSIALGKDITQQKEAEERKDFLNTLLKQDIGSKCQTIQGYLQLLEEEELSGEGEEYLQKALKAGYEAHEILDLAKKLREIEDVHWTAEKNIIGLLKHVVEKISDLIEEESVDIEEEYPEEIGDIDVNFSLKTLFSQILKTRIQNASSDRIKISLEENEDQVIVNLDDNGEHLTKEIKELFSGKSYSGVTAGSGGARYYMISQVARHNNTDIEVNDSDLGGVSFSVKLRRSYKSPEER